MSDISRVLAAFATGVISPSERAREIIRLSLADWAACGLAGAEEPVAQITRDMVLAEAGAGASVLFGGGVAPARAAALVNGATSHALDFDDTHFLHIGHPSVVIFPACLALAQQINATGAQFLETALIGFETSARIGAWLGRDHYETGFHQTATAGSFGATLACARLLGLTADETQHALGLCATRASGLKSQFGTMGKPYNAGLAAANAVEVALLISRGFISRPDGLECLQGFGDTHAGASDIPALNGLGETWVTETVSHKFHACCHGTHAALEALKIATENLPADQITGITIRTNPRWARVCNIETPQTGLEAKFSYKMTVAMALLGRDTGRADQFEDSFCMQDDARKLASSVAVVFDENIPETAAKIAITHSGGENKASFDLAEPLPLDVIKTRLSEKLSVLVGSEKASNLLDTSASLQAATSVQAFTKHLAV
ncbi:MmgE/PrpD family protein [Thalassobius sp. I31.1]|uniref:MmgE/PrpD family protein n=1 Tax=Thalassobius sp. I31.1 TaxID=2109912 RepID=UPI000D19ED9B|nr:MmgE/PrpD family protein [Thalassobius sp. I31.1]